MYKCITCNKEKPLDDIVYWIFDGESQKANCSKECAEVYKYKAIKKAILTLDMIKNQEIIKRR